MLNGQVNSRNIFINKIQVIKMKIIGMIHLKTLPGYPRHKGMEFVIAHALNDAYALVKGGVDAILVENTYDDPQVKYVAPETIAAFTLAAREVIKVVNVPVGVCVLWNDYRAAFAIAKISGARFVRIPVFTEAALTASGIIEGCAYEAIAYRHKLNANDIKILADVHVKHAAAIAQRPIAESAVEALSSGADQLVITGRFTGDAPSLQDLIEVRNACQNAIIVVGSGFNLESMKYITNYADVAIVGTAFKENDEVVVEKVRQIISKVKNL